MPVRIIKPSVSHAKPSAYRRVRASDLPAIMTPGAPRPHVPLTLLVKEWDYFPEDADRAAMVEEEPAGPDPDDLCRIAAVVHALCARDGIPIPEWVWQHRSAVPIAWDRSCVMEGFIWERTMENAPPECEYHNVWFDYQFISSQRRPITKDNYMDFNIPARATAADAPPSPDTDGPIGVDSLDS